MRSRDQWADPRSPLQSPTQAGGGGGGAPSSGFNLLLKSELDFLPHPQQQHSLGRVFCCGAGCCLTLIFFFFFQYNFIEVKFTQLKINLFKEEEFSSIQYISHVMQPQPLSSCKIVSGPQMETLHGLSSYFPLLPTPSP